MDRHRAFGHRFGRNLPDLFPIGDLDVRTEQEDERELTKSLSRKRLARFVAAKFLFIMTGLSRRRVGTVSPASARQELPRSSD